MRAENEAGIGRPSEPSKAATIRAEVGAPTELTIADLMSNSVVLTWQPPVNDGGSKISQYIVERRHLPDGRWLRCNYNIIRLNSEEPIFFLWRFFLNQIEILIQ